MGRFFRIYLVPGFVFQSIIIGGGYGTGRELVQFFLRNGPLGGFMGMLLSTILFSVIISFTFEWARSHKKFEYSAFTRSILGRMNFLYEIVIMVSLLLVLSVVGSAAGELGSANFGMPVIAGTISMILIVALLSILRTSTIEKLLAAWSLALYAVYALLIIVSYARFGDVIQSQFGEANDPGSWAFDGLKYSSYNVAILPLVLFIARNFKSRREALISGWIAGLILMIPAFLIYLAMLSQYPQIVSETIPSSFLFNALNIPWLSMAFNIVLFGTFIETGLGVLHGLNERLSSMYLKRGRTMKRKHRFLVSLVSLLLAIFLADSIGIIELVATGYDAIAQVMILLFVIPIIFLGTWQWVRPTK